MFQKIRLATQLFGAILAVILLIVGVFNFNMLYIVGAVISALFAGRVFCGWLCPMGLFTERVLKKISRNNIYPQWVSHKGFRYGFAILFLLILILGRTFIPLNVFPFFMMGMVFILATFLGIIYHGRIWCGYFCPWGIISGLFGKSSYLKLGISDKCKGCKVCTTVCPVKGVLEPALDIRKDSKEDHINLDEYCIKCLECAAKCPVKAIDFK